MGCSGTKQGKQPLLNASPKAAESPKSTKDDDCQKHKFLQQVPLFQTLDDAEIRRLAEACASAKYMQGQTVIQAGDVAREFFLIIRGEAGVFAGGCHTEVAHLQAGDYFGEVALLHDTPREATIRAHTDLRVLMITRIKFRELNLSSKVHFPCRKAVGAARKQPQDKVKPPSPKTPEDLKFLSTALLANRDLNIIVDLTEERQKALISYMWKESVTAGTELIHQGDLDAFFFYIVEAGDFDVTVMSKNGAKAVGKRSKGDSFGELAMLYSAPRAASVKAATTAAVWVLDRMHFREVLMREDNPENLEQWANILSSIPLFAPLLKKEREAMARTLVERTFSKGENIMTKGEPGVCMYILVEGEVTTSDGPPEAPAPKKKTTTKSKSSASVQKKGTVSNSKSSKTKEQEVRVFGEKQLVTIEPRDQTVTAASAKVRMLLLDRDAVCVLIGPLEDLLINNKDAKNAAAQNQRTVGQIKRKDLQTIGLLGCGGFGAVELVEHKTTKDTYAMKMLSKGYIVECGMEASVMNEKKILLMADSLFVIKLYETYNGSQSLYFLLEAALGGELYATYNRRNLFGSEPHAKFYVAGAICGFEYLHKLKIVYRDLKPENMILDIKGQVKLIDMGLAKVVVGKTFTACGTPDYFAPEIIAQTGHTHAVDWWCVGILAYELNAGSPPFEDEDPMKTYARIKKGIDKVVFPKEVRGAARAFVRDLVQEKPEMRLPLRRGGVQNLRKHEWYLGFDWQAFQKQAMTPPFQPDVNSNKDLTNFKATDADRPAVMKYTEKGTGWDKDFATCDDAGEKVSVHGGVSGKE